MSASFKSEDRTPESDVEITKPPLTPLNVGSIKTGDQKMKSINARVNPIISDLFFNHTHEQYDALNFKECTQEEIEQAILADAEAFVDAYGEIGQIGQYTPQDYANDFLARL